MAIARSSLIFLCVVVAVLTWFVCAEAAAQARTAVPGPLHLAATYTDNYKASYNADPSVRERRTWLVIGSVFAAGDAYRPPRPATRVVTPGGTALVRAPGRPAALLRVRAIDVRLGTPVLRIDSDGLWGVLVAIPDPAALTLNGPARMSMEVVQGGRVLGRSIVSYRAEPALAALPSSSIEWNGPGGRWYLGNTGTRLNWMRGVTPDYAVPYIASTWITRGQPRRLVLRAQDDTRLASIRTRIPGRAFGPWRRYSSSLAVGAGATQFDVQVRDSRGRVSRVVRAR